MGYTTNFTGAFTITPALLPKHMDYLRKFSDTRRMKRNPSMLMLTSPNYTHAKAGLDAGQEGCYYVDGDDHQRQGAEDSITSYNCPPAGQPGLQCQWIPSKCGTLLEWDGGEKFYDYVKWLQYLIAHFFNRWGYTLEGRVHFQGEDSNDYGTIKVSGENEVSVVSKEFHVSDPYEELPNNPYVENGERKVVADTSVEDGPAEQDPDTEIKVSVILERLTEINEAVENLEEQSNNIQHDLDDLYHEKEELEVTLEKVYEKLKTYFGE